MNIISSFNNIVKFLSNLKNLFLLTVQNYKQWNMGDLYVQYPHKFVCILFFVWNHFILITDYHLWIIYDITVHSFWWKYFPCLADSWNISMQIQFTWSPQSDHLFNVYTLPVVNIMHKQCKHKISFHIYADDDNLNLAFKPSPLLLFLWNPLYQMFRIGWPWSSFV